MPRLKLEDAVTVGSSAQGRQEGCSAAALSRLGSRIQHRLPVCGRLKAYCSFRQENNDQVSGMRSAGHTVLPRA